LRSLSAAVATGGAVTLYHIVGVTPEARSIDMALRGGEPQEELSFTQADLNEVRCELTDEGGDVDFVALGCPHFSQYELWEIADLLKGRRVKDGVTLWIMTPPQVYEIAKWADVANVIRDAGATLIYGSTYYGHCTFISPGIPGPTYTFTHPEYSVGNFATDSVKQAYYARPLLRAEKVFLGSKERCIEAAVTGKWS
jgi:predicted aconitase